jgi:hypothetical protein
MALDDVSVQDGQCPPQALCTFDDPSMCGWRNIAGDNFDWTRSSGRTGSSGTGPSNDHTYGTNQGEGYCNPTSMCMLNQWTFIYFGARISVIRPMRKMKSRWRKLTSERNFVVIVMNGKIG